MQFSIIDLIIIIILVLLTVFGIIRGFPKKRLVSFALSLGFSVAYLGGIPLSRALMNTDMNIQILKALSSTFPTTSTFTDAFSNDPSVATHQIEMALAEFKIPTFFQGFFVNRITFASSTVGDALASAFTFYIFTVASFLIVLIAVFCLVYFLLRPLWGDGRLFDENGKSAFGRVCGAIMGLTKGIGSVLTLLIIAVLVEQLMLKFGNSAVHDFFVSDLRLDDPSYFSIGRIFYNTISSLLNWISLPSLP